MKIRIRFNKSRGQSGRGTVDHVWRVFEESGKEYLCKNISIKVNSWGEKEPASEDWNIACEGQIVINKESSTITII